LAFSPIYANLSTPQANSVHLANGPKPDAEMRKIWSKPNIAQHRKDISAVETYETFA
jgi:hypothetical protein